MKRKTTTGLSPDYNCGDVGNLVRLTDVLNSKVERYAYDWLDWLFYASGNNLPSGLTYSYDSVGNRLTCWSMRHMYGKYNQLTGDGTWSHSCDGNSNLTHRMKLNERSHYNFNSLDQLVKET